MAQETHLQLHQRKELTVERVHPSGALRVSGWRNGPGNGESFPALTFYGYSRREAERLYRASVTAGTIWRDAYGVTA